MRIVIDMQGAQSDSRHRGIGRLTLSLVKAIIANRGEHEVILALNGLFPETIESIRAEFDGLLLQESIRVWQAPGPVRYLIAENEWLRNVAELIRESFLASLKPDLVLMSSLFEGLGDDAVTSIGMLSNTIPTAVILYDLIPFIYRDLYLENPVYEAWYERKLDHLRRAHLLLAISESSRQEAIRYLGFPSEHVVNVSAAVDLKFKPNIIDQNEEDKIRARYGLTRPFVMYTGAAFEPRKNLVGLIRSYAKLPNNIRELHQLVVVCSIQPADRTHLNLIAKEYGLKAGELVLTGFVPDGDLIGLYNLCKLFIFPSWHEGFGLPVLEAMSCGAAVIGANSSSIPEVIGREDALFNPKNDEAITTKLAQVLTDDALRDELKRDGLERAKNFSWDISAKRAITAIEAWFVNQETNKVPVGLPVRRPRLAYISPLPPERSGISDYSAELLPELARYYEIEVIVAQEVVSDPWVRANCRIRNVDWFHIHAKEYDRVLYHFGNSPFHQHMLTLLDELPGIVVLHDFFLSGIVGYDKDDPYNHDKWMRQLYHSHGYKAIQERFLAADTTQVVLKFPCNLSVLQRAQGVIVHSDYSRCLARMWYPQLDVNHWVTVPLLRVPVQVADRLAARRALNLDEDAFVVCSFGLLGPSKLNHRLLHSWLCSRLSQNERCILVFVGEKHVGDYGQDLLESIRQSGVGSRVRITGWVDTATFHSYLSAADMGVQLRTLSRGETSAAVLDCMNYGLPTIVNANGSMADLPDAGVWKLPDEFEDEQLVEALETLWLDGEERKRIGQRAQEIIRLRHAPVDCARQYFDAIEQFYVNSRVDTQSLIGAIALLDGHQPSDNECMVLADTISQNQLLDGLKHQILVDVSAIVINDLKTGIERVARSILKELIDNPPENYRVEPVYATTDQYGYRYARHFTLNFLECPVDVLADESIEFKAGDVFLGLDLHQYVVSSQEKFLTHLRHIGVRVYFVVYDLLPVLMPHVFPHGAATGHETWLTTISRFDGAICISRTVADDLQEWLRVHESDRQRPFHIAWSHIGADVENSLPTKGLTENAEQVHAALSARKSFLMVGTIEPRKGHAQTLFAFEQLWLEGVEVNLVIVGKQGWMVESLIETLRNHPKRGKRLFWLEGISDEYLEMVYSASTCLLAASEGEGFGLPLIEAAQHALPIIARDIPVFHEVAGEHGFYFGSKDPADLAHAIMLWMELFEENKHPRSDDMTWLTWREATKNMMDNIGIAQS